MKKLLSVFTVLFLFSATAIFAQEDNSDAPVQKRGFGFRDELGLKYLISEQPFFDLEYGHIFENRLGFNFDFGIHYESNFEVNTNIQLSYQLYETGAGNWFNTRLYLWGLGGYRYEKGTEYLSYFDKTTNQTVPTYTPYTRNIAMAGFGFGIDFLFVSHLYFPLQVGFISEFFDRNTISFAFMSGIGYRF